MATSHSLPHPQAIKDVRFHPPHGFKLGVLRTTHAFYGSAVQYIGVQVHTDSLGAVTCVRDGAQVPLPPPASEVLTRLTVIVVPLGGHTEGPLSSALICDSIVVADLLRPSADVEDSFGTFLVPRRAKSTLDLRGDCWVVTLPSPLSDDEQRSYLKSLVPQPPLTAAAFWKEVQVNHDLSKLCADDLYVGLDAEDAAERERNRVVNNFLKRDSVCRLLSVPMRDTLGDGDYLRRFGDVDVWRLVNDMMTVQCDGSFFWRTVREFGTIGEMHHAIRSVLQTQRGENTSSEEDIAHLDPVITRRELTFQRDSRDQTRLAIVVNPAVAGSLRVTLRNDREPIYPGHTAAEFGVPLCQLAHVFVDDSGGTLVDKVAPIWLETMKTAALTHLQGSDKQVEDFFQEAAPEAFARRDPAGHPFKTRSLLAYFAVWLEFITRVCGRAGWKELLESPCKLGLILRAIERNKVLRVFSTTEVCNMIINKTPRIATEKEFSVQRFSNQYGIVRLCVFADTTTTAVGIPVQKLSNLVALPIFTMEAPTLVADTKYAEVYVKRSNSEDVCKVTRAFHGARQAREEAVFTVRPSPTHRGTHLVRGIGFVPRDLATGAQGVNTVPLGLEGGVDARGLQPLLFEFFKPSGNGSDAAPEEFLQQLENAAQFLHVVRAGIVRSTMLGNWEQLSEAFEAAQIGAGVPFSHRVKLAAVGPPCYCKQHEPQCLLGDSPLPTRDIGRIPDDLMEVCEEIMQFEEGRSLPLFLKPLDCVEGAPCMIRPAVYQALTAAILRVRAVMKPYVERPPPNCLPVTMGELFGIAKIYRMRMQCDTTERVVCGMNMQDAWLQYASSRGFPNGFKKTFIARFGGKRRFDAIDSDDIQLRGGASVSDVLVACDAPYARLRALLEHWSDDRDNQSLETEILARCKESSGFRDMLYDVAIALYTGSGKRLSLPAGGEEALEAILVPRTCQNVRKKLFGLLLARKPQTFVGNKCEFVRRAMGELRDAVANGEKAIWGQPLTQEDIEFVRSGFVRETVKSKRV